MDGVVAAVAALNALLVNQADEVGIVVVLYFSSAGL